MGVFMGRSLDTPSSGKTTLVMQVLLSVRVNSRTARSPRLNETVLGVNPFSFTVILVSLAAACGAAVTAGAVEVCA